MANAKRVQVSRRGPANATNANCKDYKVPTRSGLILGTLASIYIYFFFISVWKCNYEIAHAHDVAIVCGEAG